MYLGSSCGLEKTAHNILLYKLKFSQCQQINFPKSEKTLPGDTTCQRRADVICGAELIAVEVDQVIERKRSIEQTRMQKILRLTKQRREDPLVVAIDSVVGQHGVSPAATGDTEVWSGRVCGVVFSTRCGRS